MGVKGGGDAFIYYTYLEKIFDIIHETHISIGHGGRTRMIGELKRNIRMCYILIFI